MSDVKGADENSHQVDDAAISYKEFLEGTPPSSAKAIKELWEIHNNAHGGHSKLVRTRDLKLYCKHCAGERTFRCKDDKFIPFDSTELSINVQYLCGDCHEERKLYSLHIIFGERPTGTLYKFGELPPFGVPVSNKVLRLFGKDAQLFQKGRQCESLGYGVAAFAYYRRVVENHKNEIFDEIMKVCRSVNAPEAIIRELEQAKIEISFTKALDVIKSALPQGLLINGHNPLLALHGALSVGLHDESDVDCLAAAQAVRLVLTDLVNKIAMLKQDDRQLNEAVQLLLKKKA